MFIWPEMGTIQIIFRYVDCRFILSKPYKKILNNPGGDEIDSMALLATVILVGLMHILQIFYS